MTPRYDTCEYKAECHANARLRRINAGTAFLACIAGFPWFFCFRFFPLASALVVARTLITGDFARFLWQFRHYTPYFPRIAFARWMAVAAMLLFHGAELWTAGAHAWRNPLGLA